MASYTCTRCGTTHDGLPFSYAAPAPDNWQAMSAGDRSRRAVLSEEQCIIDDRHFFVRGRIQIPVHDAPDPFEWGVWVSLSQAKFQLITDLWTQPGREAEPPYFGWLSTGLPYGRPTVNLKTMVHTQPVGERPLIELEPTDHPLAVEQREGISLTRVQEIAELVLHGGSPTGPTRPSISLFDRLNPLVKKLVRGSGR